MTFRRLLPLSIALVSAAALAAACAASGDRQTSGDRESTSSGTPTGQTLVVTPADAVVALGNGNASALDYTATIESPDGTKQNVTSETAFSLEDPGLGAFEGAKFTASGLVGKTAVKATARGLSGQTTVEVRNEAIIIADGAPQNAPTKFGGPDDPGRAPSIVYPAGGVMIPPNMNVLEYHFTPGTGNDLFELSFAAAGLDVKVYFGCKPVGSGCVFTPDANTWKLVAEAGRGAEPVSVKLRATSAAIPSTVGSSAAQTMSFGQEDIVGGVYYWNAGAGATVRYEFGVSGQSAEMYMNAATAGAATCVGCHVLSRDGSHIGVGVDIPGPAVFKVFDVATKSKYFEQGSLFGGGGANFFSFSSDSKQVATSNGIWTDLKDANTGATIIDKLIPNGTMPDFSPDGKKLVYAKSAQPPPCVGGICGATGIGQGSIELLHFLGGQWSAPTELVPFSGGLNNYYPTFSPDGTWILFNRAASADSYDAKDAEVWAVGGVLGAVPIKLANASTGGDSWPKWAPDVQIYKSGSLMWLTFSSRRAYGLRLPSGQTAQIWMTAFDPAKAAEGKDPSYPAFWLPFQDIASGNHIAQWVTEVARKPCTMDGECEGSEKCVNGLCVPVLK